MHVKICKKRRRRLLRRPWNKCIFKKRLLWNGTGTFVRFCTYDKLCVTFGWRFAHKSECRACGYKHEQNCRSKFYNDVPGSYHVIPPFHDVNINREFCLQNIYTMFWYICQYLFQRNLIFFAEWRNNAPFFVNNYQTLLTLKAPRTIIISMFALPV